MKPYQPDTLIKIRCTRCGVVVVDATAVVVTFDSDTHRGGTCLVTCPCGIQMLQGVSRRSLDLLRGAGVAVGLRARWLTPITRREIRWFRRRLARTRDVVSAAEDETIWRRLHTDPTA